MLTTIEKLLHSHTDDNKQKTNLHLARPTALALRKPHPQRNIKRSDVRWCHSLNLRSGLSNLKNHAGSRQPAPTPPKPSLKQSTPISFEQNQRICKTQAKLSSIIACVLPFIPSASSNGDLLSQEKKPYATQVSSPRIKNTKKRPIPRTCLLMQMPYPPPSPPIFASHLRLRPRIPSAGYYKAASPPRFAPSVLFSFPHLSKRRRKGSPFYVQILHVLATLCSPVNSPIYPFIQAYVVHALMNDSPDDPINATGFVP